MRFLKFFHRGRRGPCDQVAPLEKYHAHPIGGRRFSRYPKRVEQGSRAQRKLSGGHMSYVSMIISFLILICLVLVGAQNYAPLQLKFAWWTLETSLSAALLWASAAGAAVVAVLSLPKLSMKALQARRLRKEVRRLEGLCKGAGPESAA
jgi:uncharacterized integral membrane protein